MNIEFLQHEALQFWQLLTRTPTQVCHMCIFGAATVAKTLMRAHVLMLGSILKILYFSLFLVLCFRNIDITLNAHFSGQLLLDLLEKHSFAEMKAFVKSRCRF